MYTYPFFILSSPSGIQLKSILEIRSYLLQEGTCKCGLDCPMDVSRTFDFDDTVSDLRSLT